MPLAAKITTDRTAANKRPAMRSVPHHPRITPISSLPMSSILNRKTACPCGGGCPSCQAENLIQPKLSISAPSDKYEQESDRVAEQVMRVPEPRLSSSVRDSSLANSTILRGGTIQRACATCSKEYKTSESENRPVGFAILCPKSRTREDGMIQTKHITPLIQREESLTEEEEDDELIQVKTTESLTPEATPAISSGIQPLQGGGRPLSESERSFFEPRFRTDFSYVRVHSDTRAASVARSVNARAFTLGHNVVFGAGEYSSDTLAGRKLLAHELTHVVQQNSGLTLLSADKNSEKTVPNSQELSIVSPELRVIRRQKKNPLKGRSTSELVDYRAEKDVDAALVASKILWPIIKKKHDQGTRLKGGVTYLPQKEFEQAYIAHAKRNGDSVERAKSVRGFYNRKRDRVVVARPADLETLVHEAIHKFSDPSFQQVFASGLNEGVTQYFTNLLLDEYRLSAGKAYPNELMAGTALAHAVGIEDLARGFFLGHSYPVFLKLAKRVPGFNQSKFMLAIREENVVWQNIADMMQVPTKGTKKKEVKIFEQQQVFRAALSALPLRAAPRTDAHIGQRNPALTINRPGDAYEREPDAVAEQVLRMADPGRPPRRAACYSVRSRSMLDLGNVYAHPGNKSSTKDAITLLQRQEAADQPITDDDKAELAFYQALNFSPAGEPKEGEQSGIWLWVWNPGGLPAGPHHNKFTLYEADECAGCRRESDRIMYSSISVPGIDSLVQEGPYRYKRLIILPPLEAGNYCAYVELDINEEVEELSEINNTIEECFTVQPRNDSDEAG